jgi:hypothetical protein
MNFIRRNATYANVASTMALVMALGGTAYAGATLARNSVGSSQIKRSGVATSDIRSNAVTSVKVRNGSLRSVDFARGVLNSASSSTPGPAGPGGPTGAAGPRGLPGTNGTNGATGPAGTARAFARIDAAGVLIGGAAQAKGITQTMVQHVNAASASETAGTGVYCIGGLDFTPTSATVAPDNTDAMPAPGTLTGGDLNVMANVAVFKGEDLGYCNTTHGQVRVAIQRVDQTIAPTLANHGFFVWLEG